MKKWLLRRPAVNCIAWLGRRFMTKACDDSPLPPFWEIDNTRVQLAEMDDYPGAMATLIDALKAKGVRSDEIRFKHGDIVKLDHYVVIVRGDACKLLDRLNESEPGRLTRKERWQYYLRDVRLRLTRHIGVYKVPNLFNIHKRSRLTRKR